MKLLTTTSDIMRVVTGTAVSTINVTADYVDNASGVITPERQLTAITSATTTTIVSAPAASTQRNIRTINITNNNASTATTISVQRFNGTTAYDEFDCTLLAGESIELDENGSWSHLDVNGADYAYSAPAPANLGPAGTLAETMPRMQGTTTNTTAGATGTLFMQAIYLTAGQLVSNITIYSATTAAATTTNLFFALYSGATSPALLAQSTNQGAYTWAANTIKTLAMTTPYRVPTSGVYYIGLLQVATTIATIAGGAAQLNAVSGTTAPILHGTSTTGLTTTLPNPGAAITAGTASIYAAVS